jgi:CheY-like chemotaxis protein
LQLTYLRTSYRNNSHKAASPGKALSRFPISQIFPTLIIYTAMMQIVNVDDDSDDRDMFCMAIGRIDQDIQCIQVESGEKAIELLLNSGLAPDFIFMDINMPRMNGYECVREIYQYPNLRNTTIVMFSSTFNPRDQVDFGVLGMKFLTKTSSLTSLVGSIKKLIESNLVEGKQKT